MFGPLEHHFASTDRRSWVTAPVLPYSAGFVARGFAFCNAPALC
jgi:hypothetical protein